MQNKKELVEILQKLFLKNYDICLSAYMTKLVNEGRLTVSRLQSFMSDPSKLETASDTVLIWLYDSLKDCKFRIPSSDRFFTKEEMYQADITYNAKYENKLPISFRILDKLTDNDNYLICLSIQEINELKECGIIRWEQNMQRESVIVQTNDGFISHIRFDDKRARTIGSSMAAGTFYPNALRWHIVPSSICEYEVTDTSVILKSGFIAEIDGQHRDKGSEYALLENPDLMMKMPIILTIGNAKTAQHIINQDEERAPIDKNVVLSYKDNTANSIVGMIVHDEELDPVYKFCDTMQGITAGSGFVLKSELSESIGKYYCGSDMSRNAEVKTAKSIVKFLNELAEVLYSDFKNYRTRNNKNTHTAFKAYIALSTASPDGKQIELVMSKLNTDQPITEKAMTDAAKEAGLCITKK